MLKIIGLGNLLRGDDGIGPIVIRELEQSKYADSLKTIDLGADAFSLLEHLLDKEPLLIVDCADMQLKPGQFIKFNVTEATMNAAAKGIALHGFSFAEVYGMASKMGQPAPCTILGIQPKAMDFNTSLSYEVRKNLPLIIDAILEEKKKYDEV